MKIAVLDLLWRLTPMWLGGLVFKLTGRLWTRKFDSETGRTICYYFSKTVPVELESLAGETWYGLLKRVRR